MNVYRASITAFVLGVVAKHRPHCRCLQCPKLGVGTAWLTMCQPAASCSDVNLNVWSDPFIRCAHLCAILVQLMYTSYQPKLQTSSIQLASLPDALLGFKGTNVGVLMSVSKAEDIWGYLRKLVWSGSHYLILFGSGRKHDKNATVCVLDVSSAVAQPRFQNDACWYWHSSGRLACTKEPLQAITHHARR